MRERSLICLAVVLSVCIVFVAFLPIGSGPYTAVYGPASALRAQRAILLLVLAIGFLSTVFAVPAAPALSPLETLQRSLLVLLPGPSSPLSCGLRC